MTLGEAYEPLFQRICELNRLARAGGSCPDYSTLRREMTGLIDSVRLKILADPDTERHWPKLEMPTLFFVDSMISESALPVAHEWNDNRLAYDFKELAGDEKFYDLLRLELKDTGSDATARLSFYFTCIGLGFTGYFAGTSSQLRALMIEIIQRVDPSLRDQRTLHICPEAYDHLDTRDLIEQPPVRGIVLTAFFLALCAIFLTVNFYLFQQGTLRLRHDTETILSHSRDNFQDRFNISL